MLLYSLLPFPNRHANSHSQCHTQSILIFVSEQFDKQLTTSVQEYVRRPKLLCMAGDKLTTPALPKRANIKQRSYLLWPINHHTRNEPNHLLLHFSQGQPLLPMFHLNPNKWHIPNAISKQIVLKMKFCVVVISIISHNSSVCTEFKWWLHKIITHNKGGAV